MTSIDEQIAFIDRRIHAGTDAEFYRGILASLERLKSLDAQLVPVEPEIVGWLEHHKAGDNIGWERVDHPYAKADALIKKSDYDALQSMLKKVTVERDENKDAAAAFWRIFSLQSGDVKRLIDADIRAEKAESALKLAQEERDRHMGAVQAYIEDAEAMKQRAERAEAALKLAQEELEKANNEFGSQTAAWPDLWKRIAEIKQYSGEQWRRAEKAEALAEQNRKDAERYRWLRDSGNFVPSMCGNGWGLGMSSHAATADQLDAAIDSARAE